MIDLFDFLWDLMAVRSDFDSFAANCMTVGVSTSELLFDPLYFVTDNAPRSPEDVWRVWSVN